MDGDALLFVGAGLSFLSTNKMGHQVPDAASLIDTLLEQPSGTGSKHPLDRVAGHAIRSRGVDSVYDLLKSHLEVETVDPRLITLFDMPWRRIYTTNYDNAIEKSLTGRRPVLSLTIDDETYKAAPGSIVHINGFIERVGPNNLQSGLLLTDY